MKINFMGRDWKWNPDDKKLIQVNDWIKDVHAAIDKVTHREASIAIQAGGAMGVWPWVMSEYFSTVYTFEPHPVNYECLRENVRDRTNIISVPGALSDENGFAEVKLPASEQGNAGAYYIQPVAEGIPSPDKTKVPVFTIDALVCVGDIVGRIGLIQLDIEGFELYALKGAQDTIRRDRPVIMVEDKPLPQDKETGHVFGAVERWLVDEMGYKLHARIHRDLIFVPGES